MDLSKPKSERKRPSQITIYENRADKNKLINIEYAGITYPTRDYQSGFYSNLRYNNFEYIKSGTMCIETGGHKYMAFAGDIYILKQGVDANYYSVGNQKLEKLYFSAHGELVDGLFSIYNLSDDVVVASFNAESLMQKIHNKLISSVDLPSITYSISLYIHELIMNISLARKSADFSFDPGYSMAEAIKSYIDSGLHFNCTLKRLASRFNTSDQQIIRHFKRKYNMTPYAYFSKVRLKTAEDFLKNTTLTVGEIAEKLHFANSGCFSRAFKNYYGIYPSEYRKNNAK